MAKFRCKLTKLNDVLKVVNVIEAHHFVQDIWQKFRKTIQYKLNIGAFRFSLACSTSVTCIQPQEKLRFHCYVYALRTEPFLQLCTFS